MVKSQPFVTDAFEIGDIQGLLDAVGILHGEANVVDGLEELGGLSRCAGADWQITGWLRLRARGKLCAAEIPASLENYAERARDLIRQTRAPTDRAKVTGVAGTLYLRRIRGEWLGLILRGATESRRRYLATELLRHWAQARQRSQPGCRAAIPKAAVGTNALTGREHEVASWLSEGKTNGEVGKILGISPRTIGKHRDHIYQKLEVANRIEMARRLLESALGMFAVWAGG